MPATDKSPEVDKVRELQRKLWVCAKQSKTRRFHALYDRIHRSDVLWKAWKRVRSNRGAAGVDETTLRSIEEQGVTQFLEGIQADLKAGRYRPSPARRSTGDETCAMAPATASWNGSVSTARDRAIPGASHTTEDHR